MTLLNVSEPWVSLLSFAMYAYIVFMILGGWYLLRIVKKHKESNEEVKEEYNLVSILFAVIVIIVGFYILFHSIDSQYLVYGIYMMIVSMVLAYITIFVLFSRGKVKVDGIRYKLDKKNGTAMVLPSNYSGDLVIPSSFINPKDGATYLMTDFDKDAFVDCGELTSVTIPEGVASICNSAFLDCKALKSVTISKSVTDIGYDPFLNCINLTTIKVANGNPKYDSRNNCNAIIETATNTLAFGCKNTTIPKSVTSIKEGAFESCSGLTTITIPKSVTSIGECAFADCENLRDVVCLAEQVPTTPVNAFEDTPISEATLHVPAASIEAYRAAKPWSLFENIVPIK